MAGSRPPTVSVYVNQRVNRASLEVIATDLGAHAVRMRLPLRGLARLLQDDALPTWVGSHAVFSIGFTGGVIPTVMALWAEHDAHVSARFVGPLLACRSAATSVTNDLEDSPGPAIGTLLHDGSRHLPWLLGMPLVLVAGGVLSLRLRQSPMRHAPGTAPGSQAAD